MKKIIIAFTIAGVVALVSVTGCRKKNDNAVPDSTDLISFSVPQGWPAPAYTFMNNTLTQNRFQLGRKLFYDVRLSKDNTISCGTCHQQFAAFANLDHPVSHGINGLLGIRNSPGIFNMAWKPAFFWDGGVINLENQPINPIENPVEMDMPLAEAIERLNADADYRKLFKEAYGSETVTSQMMFRALAQFMAAMVSDNSRYDKYKRGEAGNALTEQELRGMATFTAKCGSCHKEPLFTDYTYRNNGLVPDNALQDSGRAHITNLAADRNKFMVPTLRNIDLTRPYMHDGRFSTLDAVLEHYRVGVAASATLDPLLAGGISMTDEDKADIIAFLKTLTDKEFVKDKRFSEQK